MKPIRTMREREEERQRQQREHEQAQYRARVKAFAESVGWSNVLVEQHASFITVRGDDPQGLNRSGAFENGDDIAAFLEQVVIPPREPHPLPDPSERMVSPALLALMAPDETIAEAKARLTAALREEYDIVNNVALSGGGKRVLDSGKTADERLAEINALLNELARIGDVAA